jgi:hypothetical protein
MRELPRVERNDRFARVYHENGETERQREGQTVGTIHHPQAVFLGLDDLKSSEGRHLDQIQKKREED